MKAKQYLNSKLSVVITPTQAEFIRDHSHRGVVLDDTFSITAYTLRLTTMIVIDEKGRGLPCGYLITNRLGTQDVMPLFEVCP